MSAVVAVKRDGPRGWHWIAADKYDPKVHELVDPPVRDPLDHDADGRKGGSLPVDEPEAVEAPKPAPAKRRAKRRKAR